MKEHMFKDLLNETNNIASAFEFEGEVSERVVKLVDLFEERCFECEMELFIEKNDLRPREQVEFIRELTVRQDAAFDLLKEQELSPENQAIVMELAQIQKKIKKLEEKLNEFKAQKKDLSQPIIDSLEKLELQNLRIGKILVSVSRGKTAASFNKVMDAIENQLTPAVSKLLRSTYDNLSTEQDPSLRIKVESIREGVVEFFRNVFSKLVNGVANSLSKIENLLGIREQEDVHKIEQNKVFPVQMGLG